MFLESGPLRVRLFSVAGDLIAFCWFSGFWYIKFYKIASSKRNIWCASEQCFCLRLQRTASLNGDVWVFVEDEQVIWGSRCANVEIVVEWIQGMLAESTVVWND